ncbi:MAG TPA: mandelate racemase/muconate lactonizing enzyme family protein [Plantibacter sp.]|uniref:mandelate racemase/muconate lactonizing enzyme family protein n=2 Tax=unclassified Plantibacter TaxID=2624265 RepID=UPI002CE90749|nr:mandelate racemase/muconate lactonizing enzyme family protein [Plantibacter sp.]
MDRNMGSHMESMNGASWGPPDRRPGDSPRITAVERFHVRVPFDRAVARWNSINNSQWELLEIVRVRTEDPEVVGYGEALSTYPDFCTTPRAMEAVCGRLPIEDAADDRLGLSLQMALYDAAGQAYGVPLHRLFGRPQVRDRTPLAWWNTKMPAELLGQEAARSVEAGYLAQKIKARPWFDVREQLAAIDRSTPPEFRVDIDWNSMLLDAGHALPVLIEIAGMPKIGLFESPIRRSDAAGQRRIHDAVPILLAEHFDPTLFPVWIRDDSVDAYVISPPGVTSMVNRAAAADLLHKDVFLQICGTGITTAFTAALNAVLPAARLPAVTVMNTYSDDLIVSPLRVTGGHVEVPTRPGLGVLVDEDALEQFRVDDEFVVPVPRRLLTVDYGDGRHRNFVSAEQLWEDFTELTTMPVQPPHASLTLLDDDGSADFTSLHARANRHPQWLDVRG